MWTFILILLGLAMAILSVRFNRLEKSMLDHIKSNHREVYKEFSVPLGRYSFSKHLLGYRVLKKSPYLPHDPYLDRSYVEYRRIRIWSILLIITIGVVVIISSLK